MPCTLGIEKGLDLSPALWLEISQKVIGAGRGFLDLWGGLNVPFWRAFCWMASLRKAVGRVEIKALER